MLAVVQWGFVCSGRLAVRARPGRAPQSVFASSAVRNSPRNRWPGWRLVVLALTFALVTAVTATPAFANLPRGTFSGPVDQPGYGAYSLTLVMEPGDLIPGNVAGTTTYPELSCGGNLIFENEQGQVYRFREELTRHGSCIDQGTVELTPQGEGIFFSWKGSGETATASLVRDAPPPPPPDDPFTELPANDLAFVCDTRKIAIQFLERKGGVAVVDGLAASSLVGRIVELEVDEEKVAETVVEADGSFVGRVKLPRSEKAVRNARITARLHRASPSEPPIRSRNVKLTRRARIVQAESVGGRTTLEGAVLTRTAKKPPKLTVRRRVACNGENQWLNVAAGKQKRDGTFEVSFANPPGIVGSIFEVKTQYVKKGSKAKHRTVTWAVAVDLG